VVLVAVGNDDGADEIAPVAQVAPVRDDVVDSQHVRFGEHDACIDDEDVAAMFDAHHVLADFPQAAQGYDA